MHVAQQQREEIERKFWEDSLFERPGVFALENLLNKMGEAHVFAKVAVRHREEFARAHAILELGGGQCWTSCIVKSRFPEKAVIASDISPHAIASAPMWEGIFRTRLDGVLACTSYEVPVPDASMDLIFTFQAAHHFGEHRKTLAEAKRILKPGGSMLYLCEPAVGHLLYGMAVGRVRRIRPEACEDYLIPSELRRYAGELGMAMDIFFRPDVSREGLARSAYYGALRALPFLRPVLPHGIDIRFRV